MLPRLPQGGTLPLFNFSHIVKVTFLPTAKNLIIFLVIIDIL